MNVLQVIEQIIIAITRDSLASFYWDNQARGSLISQFVLYDLFFIYTIKFMQASITFNEISDYIKAHYNVRPEFACVDKSTIKAEWKPAMFLPTMSATLHIEKCTAEQVVLTINPDGAAATFLNKQFNLLAMVKSYLPKGVEVDTENNRITANLHQIEALQKALAYADLTTITFTPTAATLTARLR